MIKTLTIDKSGRVVIPKMMRDAMRLLPGVRLEIEMNKNGNELILRRFYAQNHMQKKRGLWVYKGSKTLTIEAARKVLKLIRAERDKRIRAGS